MAAGDERRVCVARIGAAHGIRGEVRLHSFTADPMAITGYGPLETADGGRRFAIEAVRPGKDCLVARLAGIEDRNAAEQLTNLDLYVARERLPPPEDDDTYYHADLIGLSAQKLDGTELGVVAAVHDFGGGDLLEIAPAGGGASVLVPFTRTIVPQVDLAGRRLVIDPPEGTFAGTG